jgi:hypothetical protein
MINRALPVCLPACRATLFACAEPATDDQAAASAEVAGQATVPTQSFRIPYRSTYSAPSVSVRTPST